MKKRTLPSGCQIFLGILASILLGLVGYFLYLNHWYNRVQAELPEIQQKLMDINEETLAQFPPPPGVSEVGRRDLIYYYNVGFTTSYDKSGFEGEIVDYYSDLLEEAGWTWDIQNSIGQESISYFKDSKCVIVRVHSDEYDVHVYTDFLQQEFTPKLPPALYRFLRGEDPTISSCPPENARTR
ncbi:MAG TPA: hypothetical protein PLT26_13850 [Anaerolineaceae bacterium]|nr:hypothetical protein [Anaerolineaceae bacterium]HQH86633.1 hypothetical protein [Anaerolineaceae bacterium]